MIEQSYMTHRGERRTFERKGGALTPGSDPLLLDPPHWILAQFCTFRALPVDLDTFNP